MVAAISASVQFSFLDSSYQRLADAEAQLSRSKAQVDLARQRLQESTQKHDSDQKEYANALQDTTQYQEVSRKYALENGSQTEQVPPVTYSVVNLGTPTVQTTASSTEAVGSTVDTTA